MYAAWRWYLITETYVGAIKYEVSPKRNRTFEIARQRAGAACSWRWRCVAGTLSFILTLATSRYVNWSSSYTGLSERVFSALSYFLQVEKWRILKSNVFAWNSVSNWEKLLRRPFRCCNRLMGRMFEPYARSRVVPAFQIEQNVHRRRSQIWTAFHVNGRRSCWETACCDSWKSCPNCPWGFQRSRHL
jgi:hypothetical protein